MTTINKLMVEEAAKIGYKHSMKQLDKVYPETAGMFEWSTENKECRKEWIEKAELMLADTMRENGRMRQALKNIAAATGGEEWEGDALAEAISFEAETALESCKNSDKL